MTKENEKGAKTDHNLILHEITAKDYGELAAIPGQVGEKRTATSCFHLLFIMGFSS